MRVGAGAWGRGVPLTVLGPVTRHDALHVLLRPDGEALERRAAQILDVAWRGLAPGLGGRGGVGLERGAPTHTATSTHATTSPAAATAAATL